MSRTLIESVLATNALLSRQQSITAWLTDVEAHGEKVALFRKYLDGDHRANLTSEMRKLLRISDTGSMNEFNDNYSGIVVQTMVDRLVVTSIDADTDAGTAWGADLLNANRFDGLQGDLHESAVGDGDTFAHAYWDNELQRVVLTHEPAYDGVNGVVAIHNTPGSTQPDIAIKIWRGTLDSIGDTTYCNVYYPDRIEKYVQRGTGGPERRVIEGEAWPAPWVMPDGSPIGVPFVHFRNRGAKYSDFGKSEIEDAIPLQDALNRTLYSMVMTAELTAFQLRWARGFRPPSGLTPGMWVMISPDVPLAPDQIADLGVMEQGQIAPFIEQARWLTAEIGKVTRTPAPEFSSGDNASGESLKQREIGLLGKCQRFQVKAGNAWEDLMALAHRIQTTYGAQKPPAVERWRCQWADVELRSDTEIVDNVLKVADRIGERETLRQLAGVFGWDADKIEELLAEKREDESAKLATMVAGVPGLGGANFGMDENANNQVQPGQQEAA